MGYPEGTTSPATHQVGEPKPQHLVEQIDEVGLWVNTLVLLRLHFFLDFLNNFPRFIFGLLIDTGGYTQKTSKRVYLIASRDEKGEGYLAQK